MTEYVSPQALSVYVEGDRVWREVFPVIIAEDGEKLLSHDTTLQLEERQKLYLQLARRGKLPEPTATVEIPAEPRPSPPRVLDSRLESVVLYEEDGCIWEEEFPAVVYSDGHVTFEIAVADEIEARRARFAELADRGELPDPTGRARPGPEAPKAPCVVATRTQLVPVYQQGTRLWQEEFPVVVYETGEVGLGEAALRTWKRRQKHYLALAERGELPEPTESTGKGSHEAAGA